MPKPQTKTFTVGVAAGPRRRIVIPVPFDPDDVWGAKREHRVSGTIDGHNWRGTIEVHDGGHSLLPGPAWSRDCPVEPGRKVKVVLSPEGPQRDDLAPDLAAALEAEPAAGEFFDSLAQFYRKGYLRWIDATKRKPNVRAERIRQVVSLLKAGKKERSAD